MGRCPSEKKRRAPSGWDGGWVDEMWEALYWTGSGWEGTVTVTVVRERRVTTEEDGDVLTFLFTTVYHPRP